MFLNVPLHFPTKGELSIVFLPFLYHLPFKIMCLLSIQTTKKFFSNLLFKNQHTDSIQKVYSPNQLQIPFLRTNLTFLAVASRICLYISK